MSLELNGDGQMFDSADEIGPQEFDVSCRCDRFEALGQFLKQDADFEPSKMHAQTDMRPVLTKRQMLVLGAVQINGEWVRNGIEVAIGRGPPIDNLIACANGLAVHFGIFGARAAEIGGRGGPADDFIWHRVPHVLRLHLVQQFGAGFEIAVVFEEIGATYFLLQTRGRRSFENFVDRFHW